MANQLVKQTNLQIGYTPADPKSYPDNLSITNPAQDERAPAGVYDGYNFMPTAYGYKSYFGTDKLMGIDALAEKIDYVFIFQTPSRKNYLIALCDTGVWIKYGATTGAWTQLVVLPGLVASSGQHYEWSFTIIENVLYMYRQNGATFWTIKGIAADPGYELEVKNPNFLNMEAQMGIFRAGDRLGFWDSANAVAWSSIDLFDNFTPDIESGAGITTFGQIIGAITNILSHGDGFIVYCTKSIVHVSRNADSPYLWEPSRILQDTGIAYRRQVVASVPDTLHYGYTITGIYVLQNGQPEVIAPDVFDYFQMIATPKYLTYMGGRYLFVSTLDEQFMIGNADYTDVETGDQVITLPTLDFADLMEGIEEGTYPELSLCDGLDAIGEGSLLAENRENCDWRIEVAGIGITTQPILSATGADSPFIDFGSRPGSVPVTEGSFFYDWEIAYCGELVISWASGSPANSSITIYRGGVIQTIIPVAPYASGTNGFPP